MRIELLMVGDELLGGAIVDTNSAWLMGRLYDLGVETNRKTVVGDDVETIASAIEEAACRKTELLVICGGLGPTEDDLTGDAVALAAGAPRDIDPEAKRLVESRLLKIGMEATKRQLRQARLPSGSKALENAFGTAPGFFLALSSGCAIFCLPGPPREFRPMAEDHVLPFLDARLGGRRHAALTLRTFGKGESFVASLIEESAGRFPHVRIGFQLVFPEIHLRLRAKGRDETEAGARCEEAALALEKDLGDILFGREKETLPSVVSGMLDRRNESLSLAESCTGGLLGSLVTETPGASRYLLASMVTYSNEMKVRLLGVPEETLAEHGAVSEQCARAMAEGVLERTGAAHALSITGVAGPGGGTDEKPVGTVWLALASQRLRTLATRRRLAGDREMIRRASAFHALDLLRRRLMD